MRHALLFVSIAASPFALADINYPLNTSAGVKVTEIACDEGVTINDGSIKEKLAAGKIPVAVKGQKFVQFSSATDLDPFLRLHMRIISKIRKLI